MKPPRILMTPILKAAVIAEMALTLAGPLPAAADTALEAQIEAMRNEPIGMKNKLRALEAAQARTDRAEKTAATGDADNTGCIATAKGGIQVSCDNGFSARVGGRIMVDTAFYGSDDTTGTTKLGDGTEVRRARLFLSGTMFENWAYKTQFDFANNAVDSQDVWLQYKGLREFNNLSLKIGNQKVPFGLENMTSSRFITFMERADHNSLFWQGENRRLGLAADIHGDNWGLALGGFGSRLDDDPVSEGDEQWSAGGRLHFAPITEVARNVHLGFSALYRNPNQTTADLDLTVRPAASHVTDVKLVNTGVLSNIDHVILWAPEFAAVYGPFSVQSEYTAGVYERGSGLDDLDFSNAYVSTSYFLTGESRAYDTKKGAFGRVTPKKNLGDGGIGAWEVGLRYDATDASDENVLGGEQDTLTVGLNWYPNPYVRFMANYANTDGDANANAAGTTIGDEDVDVFQLRAQIDF